MNQEAMNKLSERLDECLLEQAELLHRQENRPDISALYEISRLAKVHMYLKMVHDFSPGEAEALLRFEDPLMAARWCWEANYDEFSFPICELLNKINAWERFPQATQDKPPLAARFAELKALLNKNLDDYKARIQACDKAELIERADEIAAAVAAHEYMTREYKPKADEVDFLLRHDDPLQIVRAFWPERPCEFMSMDFVMKSLMENMYIPPEVRQPDELQEKASVRERLQEAARETGQRPAPEDKPRGGGER